MSKTYLPYGQQLPASPNQISDSQLDMSEVGYETPQQRCCSNANDILIGEQHTGLPESLS